MEWCAASPERLWLTIYNIINMVQLCFIVGRERESSYDKQKLKEFLAIKLILLKMLEGIHTVMWKSNTPTKSQEKIAVMSK